MTTARSTKKTIKGSVTFIGAGPGDPGLLTVRAADVISAADVVLADAAVPAVLITDTIKRVQSDRVVETVDRSGLVATQTPQAFRSSVLRAAHENSPEATDDAALVEAAGGSVVVVTGDARNLKVTTLADVAIVEALLGEASR